MRYQKGTNLGKISTHFYLSIGALNRSLPLVEQNICDTIKFRG